MSGRAGREGRGEERIGKEYLFKMFIISFLTNETKRRTAITGYTAFLYISNI